MHVDLVVLLDQRTAAAEGALDTVARQPALDAVLLPDGAAPQALRQAAQAGGGEPVPHQPRAQAAPAQHALGGPGQHLHVEPEYQPGEARREAADFRPVHAARQQPGLPPGHWKEKGEDRQYGPSIKKQKKILRWRRCKSLLPSDV